MTRTAYTVKVAKRDTGEIVEGTMTDDGLQSLWPVTSADGEIHYVSVLDTFLDKTPTPTCTCGRPLPLALLRDLDITKSHRCECGAVSALIPVPAPEREPEPDPTAAFLGKVEDAWHEATMGDLALVDNGDPMGHDEALAHVVTRLAVYARETIEDVGAAQTDRHGNDNATVDNDELAHRIAEALDLVLYGTRH